MRYFNENLGYPQPEYLIKRLYGINPDNDPARAALIGIYPLQQRNGFEVERYTKANNTYYAIPKLSETEYQLILDVRDNYG